MLFRQQNVGQNQNTKTANISFENSTEFVYWKITLKKQNSVHENMTVRPFMNSENACYHSVYKVSVLSFVI